MKKVIASLVVLAGMSASANAQLMKMLVSSDGVNFGPVVTVVPGQTVQVLVTGSYTGTGTAIAGFGSANFQPIVSNWTAGDTLLPLRQGGNTLPADGSGMIKPQFYLGTTAGSGQHVTAGYVPGTYGRVNPMGRSYLGDPATMIQGFTHVNPDSTGTTYLRIAQASNTGWIGTPTNVTGGSGVNAAQLFTSGRTTNDPDFWGNREVFFSTDPDNPGWQATPQIVANDIRRTNVELFRFAYTVGSRAANTDMLIDAPVAGQQIDSNGLRYMGFFTFSASTADPNSRQQVVVQTGLVHVIVPTPASMALLGLGGLMVGRRRR